MALDSAPLAEPMGVGRMASIEPVRLASFNFCSSDVYVVVVVFFLVIILFLRQPKDVGRIIR